jgi:hypothetical protein
MFKLYPPAALQTAGYLGPLDPLQIARPYGQQELSAEVASGLRAQADKLATVDHSSVRYHPFRRSFYLEDAGLRSMGMEDAKAKLPNQVWLSSRCTSVDIRCTDVDKQL